MSKTRKPRNNSAAVRRRERRRILERQKERALRRRNRRLRFFVGAGLLVVLGILMIQGISNRRTSAEIFPDASGEPKEAAEIRELLVEDEGDPEDPEAEVPAEEEADDPMQWSFNENLARRRVQSEVALLYSLDTREIIYEKNMDRVTYPASLTKMMTQLVAIELTEEADLSRPVQISEEIYFEMVEAGAAMSGFSPGETVTLEDLFYANFLASAGDASDTLAMELAGSLEAFVGNMNAKARELGMDDTHFVNPTGLHDDEHVTTARDLLTLALSGMEDERFIQYFTTRNYETRSLDETGEEHVIKPRLWLNLEDSNFPYKVLGGKTGFTEEAGLCLTTVVERNGSHFLIITMGAPYEISRTTDVADHMWLMRGLTLQP